MMIGGVKMKLTQNQLFNRQQLRWIKNMRVMKNLKIKLVRYADYIEFLLCDKDNILEVVQLDLCNNYNWKWKK
jgi:hypothetical protein